MGETVKGFFDSTLTDPIMVVVFRRLVVLLMMLLTVDAVVPSKLVVQSVNPFLEHLHRSCNRTTRCSCCGWCGDELLRIRYGRGQWRAAECPICGSRERHRSACERMATDVPWRSESPSPFRLLHFGPQSQMATEVERVRPRVDQWRVDYFQHAGYTYDQWTHHADVTRLQFPSDSMDAIIIVHVLEHVWAIEDALSELARVLRSSNSAEAWMIVEVPCSTTLQQSIACSPNSTSTERRRRCGQFDHYWLYSCDDFYRRVSEAGFVCTHPTEPAALGRQMLCRRRRQQPSV
jgi:SAM-dependent methyltransferase